MNDSEYIVENLKFQIYKRQERIEALQAAIREHKKEVLEMVSEDSFMWPAYDKKLWSILDAPSD